MIYKYNPKLIGERIKECRDCEYKMVPCSQGYDTWCKFTQSDLANKIGVTRQTIANWENGKRVPSISELFALCNFFKCDPGYILGLPDMNVVEFEDMMNLIYCSDLDIKVYKELHKKWGDYNFQN